MIHEVLVNDGVVSQDYPALFCVFIVDRTVKEDDKAVKQYFVRAASSEEAKIKAALRDQIAEEFIDDYDIIAHYVSTVKQVSEDAE